VAGTPVATAAGPVAIESISVGDMVTSANPDTGEVAEREVLEAYVRQSGELVHIWICGEETKMSYAHNPSRRSLGGYYWLFATSI
jgi:hypothetical protein